MDTKENLSSNSAASSIKVCACVCSVHVCVYILSISLCLLCVFVFFEKANVYIYSKGNIIKWIWLYSKLQWIR